MSYILEALKKDKLSQQQDLPVFAQSYSTASESRSGLNNLGWGVLLTLAILGAVVLGYFMGRGQAPVITPPPQNTSQIKVTEPVVLPQPVAATPAISNPEKIAAEEYFDNPPVKQSVTVVADGNHQTQLSQSDRLQETAVKSPLDTEQAAKGEFKLQAADGVSNELLQLVQSAIDETVQAPQPSTQQTALPATNYDDVQSLTSLSTDFQQQVPNMDFTQHIYSSSGDGWIQVNGTDVKEGEMVSPGVRLVKITPQKVILNFRDVNFSLPAMSSW